MDKARELWNTQFSEVTIILDLTSEQRKEEADMLKEGEKRNGQLTQEDKAKNLEWARVGARGERRLIKTVRRPTLRGGMRGTVRGARAAAGGIVRGAARGSTRGAMRGALIPELLPPRQRALSWNPVTNRTADRSGRNRGRPSSKRKRGEMEREEEESEQEYEEMQEEGEEVLTQQQRQTGEQN
jgi:hypothetical protein